MIAALFTCNRDAGKARLATCTIPADWPVVWVVDACDASLPMPTGVERLVAPFARGPNLAGPAACLGVADVLAGLAASHGRVAKIDSDCLLVSPDFLFQGDLAGMAHQTFPGAAYGLAYAMGDKAAQRAAEGVKRGIGLGAHIGGEDVWVTSCAAGGADGRVRVGSFWETPHDGRLPPKGVVAIHCGGVRYAPRQGGGVEREMTRLGDALGLWRRGG